MNIEKITKIFLDADVLVAGSYNPQGGSEFILECAKKEAFTIMTSKLVLQEAKRALLKKLGKEALFRFYQNMVNTDFLLAHKPTQKEIEKYSQFIHQDDAHVIAAVTKNKADFLITLNKRHFFTPKIKEAGLNIIILTPKMFIEEYYKKMLSRRSV